MCDFLKKNACWVDFDPLDGSFEHSLAPFGGARTDVIDSQRFCVFLSSRHCRFSPQPIVAMETKTMGNIIRAIARALRAMRSTAWTWVQEGGRWIMKLNPFAAGATSESGPSDEVRAEVADMMADRSVFQADEETFGVKRLSRLMWAGVDLRPEHLEGISDRELDWLRVLDQGMLHTIAMADHSQIRAHMRGTAPIRGVVPYDPQAVADMKSAWAMPVPSNGQRTLRDLLEAEGLRM